MGIFVWRLLAIVCIALGLIGVVLPVFPTVPFLLLAAAAASRGWPWLDQQLTSHATYGPYIIGWRERRAVPRAGKWFATLGLTGSIALLWLTPLPLAVQVALMLGFLVIGVWIWMRPEQ